MKNARSGAGGRSASLPLEDLSQLRWRLIWIYDAKLTAPEGPMRYCAYPTAAWFIREGEIRLHFASGEESYGAGQWVFPRQAEGQQTFSPDARILSVRFQAEWPDGTPLFERHRTIVIADDNSAADSLKQSAGKLLRFLELREPRQVMERRLQRLPMEDYLRMQPLVGAWMFAYFQAMTHSGLATKERPPHAKVNEAMRLLQSQPLNRPLRISSLARELGISVSQLNKNFVRAAGITPATFWQERKLNAARSWLLYGSDSMKAIATDLGFTSPGNFSQWFRAGTGCPPKHFRASQSHL